LVPFRFPSSYYFYFLIILILGITVPILPGIMPIRTHAGLLRMCKLGGTFIPPKILEDLEAIKDNDEAVQDYGKLT
jgi:methylenetetrahydrofolate reductase (NADPH)